MTEIEILRKQLVAANAEIQTLTMRLRNAEILYEREMRKNEVKQADEMRSPAKEEFFEGTVIAHALHLFTS